MTRSLKFLAIAIVLLIPAARAAEAADLSPAGKRSLRFMKAVHDSLRNYHINGKDHSSEELVKGAWEAMIRVLEARQIRSADPEKSAILIQALKRANMTKLEDLVDLIDRFAARVGDVNVEELAEVGAKGMFLPLQDPFSALTDVKTLGKMMRSMSSEEDNSLGVNPTRTQDKVWKVAHVRGGYPASEAGLLIDDVILEIDGVAINDIPPTEVGEKFSAEVGKSVKMTIMREGWSKPRVFELVQDASERKTVPYEMLPGNIGYVRCLIFNQNMGKDVEKALNDLEAKGMKALILDLRGNPGGALQVCTAVADMFLQGGKMIATMDSRHPFMGGKQTFTSKDEGTHPQYPMAVLIDRSSASASEMLSGALKANDRAVVIGQTSYGKGVGQSVIPLMARLSHHKEQMVLYLTFMEYFLPGNVIVQHKGVEPHIPMPAGLLGPEMEKVFALRDSGAFKAFAAAAVAADRAASERAVSFSEAGIGGLPGLIEAFGDLRTDLADETVRAELARAVRIELEKAGSRKLVKPREDDVLCRALFEMCRKIELKRRDAPELGFVFDMFGRKADRAR